jgi:hypothetical protein
MKAMKYVMGISAVLIFMVGCVILLGSLAMESALGEIEALIILCWSAILFIGTQVSDLLERILKKIES